MREKDDKELRDILKALAGGDAITSSRIFLSPDAAGVGGRSGEPQSNVIIACAAIPRPCPARPVNTAKETPMRAAKPEVEPRGRVPALAC